MSLHPGALPWARRLGLLWLIVLTWPWSLPAAADERILLFRSEIQVAVDGSMQVRETIKVRAEGEQIKRGIYRDFPTRYRDRLGQRKQVGFQVLSVERDGFPEAYHTEARQNGVRVYMGQPEVLLEPGGVYTYRLSYRTERQLGYFADHDELYWNVTGNGWSFPIDEAKAVVRLPSAGDEPLPLELEAYTGPEGARGRAYVAWVNARGEAEFATTAALGPEQGLTIVVSWPKGVVAEPDAAASIGYFLRDNLGMLAGVGGSVLVLVYYAAVWLRVGRDPDQGVIIPRFEPPEGLSPAVLRYISRMGFDHRTFAAALVNMAVKGYLSIHEDGSGKYELRREGRSDAAQLSAGERKLAEALFAGSDHLHLVNTNHTRVAAAIKALKDYLKAEFHRVYFFTNGGYLVPGLLLSALVVVGSGLGDAEDKGAFLFLTFWLTGWSFGVFFLWTQRQFLMAALFSFAEVGALVGFGALVAPWMVAVLLGLVLLNILFYYLLKAPTRSGRKLMDAIDGFKMYLAVAERDRLNLMNPPERTPELFERYLPYALALGVDQQWSEQFSDVLARAASDERGYAPRWYHGSHWDRLDAGRFGSALGGSITSAIAASATAPGSHSGAGGGGSSGGGGGGGGGGGW